MTMNEEDVERAILDRDWSAESLHEAAGMLRLVEESPRLQRMLAEYDSLRRTLAAAGLPSGAAAEGAPEPPGGWTQFESGLRAALEPPALRRRPWRWAIAAGLLAAFAGGAVSLAWLRPRPPGAEAARLRDPDLRRGASLYQEVNTVLDRRVSWVAASGLRSDFGLTADPASPARLLVLRLALSVGGGEPILTDLVILPGEAARFELPLPHDLRLTYNVATTAETPSQVSVWVDLSGPDAASRATLATVLPPDGQAGLRAASLLTRDGSYDLFFARREIVPGAI
jgi:hypothetical protein